MGPTRLSWLEIDRAALKSNISAFRRLVGEDRKVLLPVKANAYGHGMELVAGAAIEAGVDWLGVHSLEEASALRRAGFTCPILVLGHVPLSRLPEAVAQDLRLVVCNEETVRGLGKATAAGAGKARIHVKLETGTNRQGVEGEELEGLVREALVSPGVDVEGACTHFANIEDTTDHGYAMGQVRRFEEGLERLAELGAAPTVRHTACSAAAMLFPETHFDMIRVGISVYGLWPSRETFVSMLQTDRPEVGLVPVLSWKTTISQVKTVREGSYIGYGCTYRTTRTSRIAILPIGYSDGYDRGLSNVAHVLIRGVRAPIRGRVCMNLTMVDVTDIPDARLEDEVVLLGCQGEERITAEDLAGWSGTINYEVVARINPLLERVAV